MDPNKSLSEIRELIRIIESSGHWTIADELAEVFNDLDQWLSKGGFLPKDWQPKR